MARNNIDQWVYDGYDIAIDGMNSAMEAEHLAVSQFARGINVVTRKGVIATRFGLTEWPIADEAAKTGTFQGGLRYQLNSAKYICFVVSGRIYVLNVTDDILTDMTTAFGVSMLSGPRCYFCKAEKYLVIQDGQSPAVYLDGVSSAAQRVEIPIGTIMAYGHGRLFVVPKTVSGQDGRRFILAGNIFLPNDPLSVLTFTESDYYAGGGAFAMPAEMEFIGALGFIRTSRDGSAEGPLIAIAKRGAVSFAVNEPRETLYDLVTRTVVREGWQDHDISQILFQEEGSASPFSVLPRNADLLFRDTTDGMRSLSATVAENQQSLNKNSLSGEMVEVFSKGGNSMLDTVSMIYSDNRLMCTAVPSADETYFSGVASMDLLPVNNVKQQLPPSFDGTFTGPRWLQLLSCEYDGRDRMFACVKTDTGWRLLYEDPSAITDADGEPINCRVYTRKMDFRAKDTIKQLDSVRLWLSDVKGDVVFSVYVRTDDFPYWTQLDKTVTFKAPVTGAAQQRRNARFAANNELSDPIEGGNGKSGYFFQFALVWSGHCKIKLMRARAFIAADSKDAASIMAEEDVELSANGQLDLEATDYDNAW